MTDKRVQNYAMIRTPQFATQITSFLTAQTSFNTREHALLFN